MFNENTLLHYGYFIFLPTWKLFVKHFSAIKLCDFALKLLGRKEENLMMNNDIVAIIGKETNSVAGNGVLHKNQMHF